MEKIISLIDRFSQASEFETLLKPHIMRMYRLAYRLTSSPADAEDLVQDVLVKIYPKRHGLHRIEKLRPWLGRVLYTTFVDQYRRTRNSPLRLIVSSFRDDQEDCFEAIPSDKPNPEEYIEEDQTRISIQRAMQSLNAEQRHVCMLHDAEGYTLSELEIILEVPIGTLKSRLHRARKKLRKILQDETF